MRTIGTSNKLLQTLYGAVGAQAIALLVSLGTTGEFDRAQWVQLGGLALSVVLGYLLGYRADPDTVEFDPELNPPAGSVDASA